MAQPIDDHATSAKRLLRAALAEVNLAQMALLRSELPLAAAIWGRRADAIRRALVEMGSTR